MNERIGVIGLGRMGRALAVRFASQGAMVRGLAGNGTGEQEAAAEFLQRLPVKKAKASRLGFRCLVLPRTLR